MKIKKPRRAILLLLPLTMALPLAGKADAKDNPNHSATCNWTRRGRSLCPDRSLGRLTMIAAGN
jgi:hypothetical protein